MKKIAQLLPGLLAVGLFIAVVAAGIVHLQEQRDRAVAGWSQGDR